MVTLFGKPILEHQVEWLKAGGITDIVFLAGYRCKAIENHFGNGRDFGFNAQYSVEESPLGRGGAIKMGFAKVPASEDAAVVLNGDTITDERLDYLTAIHQERREESGSILATVMLVPMVSPYGLVDIDETGKIPGFREKVEMDHWINGGIYLFNPHIVQHLPDLGDHEVDTFPQLARPDNSQRWRLSISGVA
jgi:NDP-sugar pyrophosphorylase family protein